MPELALVTGATGGIGKVICRRLLAEGYSVIALGHTTSKVSALEHEVLTWQSADGCALQSLMIDVSKDYHWSIVHKAIEASQHHLSLLVVCHGALPRPEPTMSLSVRHFEHTLRTDVTGALFACQTAAEYMIPQRRGNIVLVSSLHAKMTYPQRTAYAVAKAGVVALGRSLAVEWGEYNIRVNTLLPWQCTGERSQRFIVEAAQRGIDLEEAWKQRSPMRTLVTPEQIADAVLWLAKAESVNGAEIVLDGGVSASMWYQPFMKESQHAVP